MTPKELFQAGRLNEAILALGAELRDHPEDAQRRTFLFELLCFAGEYDRAEKHLAVLSGGGPQAGMGGLLYRSALHAERTRQDLFQKRQYPQTGPAREVSGSLNGKAFQDLRDADPRIGARLELFAAGQYMWIPLEHIASVQMERPRRLRDLLWSPAVVRTGPRFEGLELGEVLLPAMAPLSWKHSDDEVRLGRVTDWVETEDQDWAPVGQKLLLVDGEEFPFLELRQLEVTPIEAAVS